MSTYQITDSNSYSQQTITNTLFGTAGNASYDFEFDPADPNKAALIDLMKDINISVLRYPGGTTTDKIFTEVIFNTMNWDASTFVDEDGQDKSIMGLDQIFALAGEIGADVNLVLPTRVAFDKSMGQAMHDGTYGTRETLDAAYLGNLVSYIEAAAQRAAANGVSIKSLEIGNEFWLGGEMTAEEYGGLAVEILEHLAPLYPDVEFLVQATASSARYSEKNDTTYYLEPDGDDFIVYHPEDLPNGPDAGWIPRVVVGNGSGVDQSKDIAAIIKDSAIAKAAIDGVVLHSYFDDGFGGIDSENSQTLKWVPLRFNETLFGKDNTDQFVEEYITEWSPREKKNANGDVIGGNALGLEYAQTTVEAFFELASNDVTNANFWPLTFATESNITRTLIDTIDMDLTFGGEAFKLLSNSLEGLSTLFDYDVAGEIDVHGFGNGSRLVLFAGERSGNDRHEADNNGVTLDLENFALSGDYFMVTTHIGTDGNTTDDKDDNPIVTYSNGRTFNGDSVTFSLDDMGLRRIEMTAITSGSDTITGRDGNDNISGKNGADDLFGQDGRDLLYGGNGADNLFGGDGNDLLSGGNNDDDLFGGDGNDRFLGGAGADRFFGGAGRDLADYYNIATNFTADLRSPDRNTGAAIGDIYSSIENLRGGSGNNSLRGDAASNTILGQAGDDRIYGRNSNDRLFGGAGDDRVYGGSGLDRIIGDAGNDALYGGAREDTFIFAAGSGHDKIHDFVLDYDVIQLTNAPSVIEYSDTAAGVVLTLDEDTTITLTGISADGITSAALFGNAGDDITLLPEGGAPPPDSIVGTSGNDRFLDASGADHYDGLGGTRDAVDYGNASGGVVLDMIDPTNNEGYAAGDLLTNIEFIYGSDDADVLIGNSAITRLYGGGGNDIIADGTGATSLWGGLGDDTFVFAADNAKERVYDFEQNADKLDISAWGITDIDALSISSQNGKTQIKIAANRDEHVQLEGEFNLTETDFIFG